MPAPLPSLAWSATALLAVLLGGGCAARLPPPTPVEATIASSHWPRSTVADLERGRGLYLERCSGCHVLYQPKVYPAERWQIFVEKMQARAKLRPAQARDVLRYLAAASESERNPQGRASASLAGRMGAQEDQAGKR